jgi:hypothetical protein
VENYFNFDGKFVHEKGTSYSIVFTLATNIKRSEADAIENDKVTEAIQASIDSKLVDLTGYSAVMTVKDAENNIIIVWSTETGHLTIDGESGDVALTLLPGDTVDLEAKNYYYDLTLTSPAGDIYRDLEGRYNLDVER